jgi:hypothetical protein
MRGSRLGMFCAEKIFRQLQFFLFLYHVSASRMLTYSQENLRKAPSGKTTQ